MNNVNLIGRMTKDAELRYTQSGTAVASFNLAIERFSKNADGGKLTDYIPITAWGKTAEFVANYTHKGLRIGITGTLQSKNWEDKEGNKRVSIGVTANSIDFADGASKTNNTAAQGNNEFHSELGDEIEFKDGELPF